MALDRLNRVLTDQVNELVSKGTAKGKEDIIVGVKKAQGEKGPRYFLKGEGEKEFLRMNSNSYLGLTLQEDIIKAEEDASREFGVGPGAVRFINGTFKAHRDLEKKLAEFHKYEDAMIYSAAYATMIGVFAALTSKETIIISDELNHNCIINAIRLSRPKDKKIYKHNDMEELEEKIKESVGKCKRVLIVTDGIFSMRGDNAPLDVISELSKRYDSEFPENIMLMVDDSHGIGAIGETGRGVEEYTNADSVDVLIGTLGKAFGVNGGYVVSSEAVTRFLREKAVTYIYSNPITVGEAAACIKAIEFLDSEKGLERLKYVGKLMKRFENGLDKLGFEYIKSDHPIVPLMVRDTEKTTEIVSYLKENGVLSTGLNFPVVPRGDQEIRFQVNGNHTPYDIDFVLELLKKYKENH
ncbi:MAG TPA: aminotransferase class I/II-fold pyridoxal phosphate-dependent enzyme [Candidatus Krumholzibacteriaceae bacterium]|nr:aminotransferase class I/II-fold pyridoxal phosphate-dependent enzyme [Candidatus Krumholzibacteriaceae bacterium]